MSPPVLCEALAVAAGASLFLKMFGKSSCAGLPRATASTATVAGCGRCRPASRRMTWLRLTPAIWESSRWVSPRARRISRRSRRSVCFITGMSHMVPSDPSIFSPLFQQGAIDHEVGLHPATRGPATLTVAEHPFHRDLVIGVTLSRTLWRYVAFRQHVDLVRASSTPIKLAWEISLRYARRERRRKLIANLLLNAALVPERYSETVLDRLWERPIANRDGRPLKRYPRVTPKTAKDAARGSELIARRGAGLCIVPGCHEPRTKSRVVRQPEPGVHQEYEASLIVYCLGHHGDDSRYADEKAIEVTFKHALEAWPGSHERDVLLWWRARRQASGASAGLDRVPNLRR